MKKLIRFAALTMLSISLCNGVTTVVNADSLAKPQQSKVYEDLTKFTIAPSDAYDYFIRGLTPEADKVSSNGNLTTDTSQITFDIMQLSSYDHAVLKDMGGNIIAVQPIPNKLQLNRITFTDLKGKLKAGQLYSVRVTSSEGFRELSVFFTLPVEG